MCLRWLLSSSNENSSCIDIATLPVSWRGSNFPQSLHLLSFEENPSSVVIDQPIAFNYPQCRGSPTTFPREIEVGERHINNVGGDMHQLDIADPMVVDCSVLQPLRPLLSHLRPSRLQPSRERDTLILACCSSILSIDPSKESSRSSFWSLSPLPWTAVWSSSPSPEYASTVPSLVRTGAPLPTEQR